MNRKPIFIVAALVAGAALAPSAHGTTLAVACDRATFHVGDTPARAYEVVATGHAPVTGVGKGTVTLDLTLQGAGTVTLRTGSYHKPLDVTAGSTVTRPFSCPTPAPEPTPEPTPEPPPAVPAPPVLGTPAPPVPPNRTRLTCPELRGAGAGPRSLRARGCTIRMRPPTSCAALMRAVRAGAGAKWKRQAVNRGCTLPPPVRYVPVTG